MHISYDRPSGLVWSIDSTNHDAAFVTPSEYLMDGKVAKPARMRWDSDGSLDTTVTVTAACSLPFVEGDIIVAAIFMPKTAYAIPANVLIEVLLDGVPLDGMRTVALNSGATSMITMDTAVGSGTIGTVGIRIWNDKSTAGGGHTTWASSEQVFDIGEFWFGTLREFKNATDPKIELMGGPTERRSRSNQPWPLHGKSYRRLTAALTPMDRTNAYASRTSFDALRYQLAQKSTILVLPRIYTPGTSNIDSEDLHQLAILGSVDSIMPLQAHKDGPYWMAGMVCSESPP